MGRVGAALVVACAALCGSVPVAAGSSSDAQSTHAYLVAQYRLVTAELGNAAAARGAETTTAARIARECPGVVSGMPQEPQKPFSMLSARVRGEGARLDKQKQTIESELYAAIALAGDSSDRPAEEAYAADVRQLSWSNPAIASMLQAATTTRLEVLSAPAPPFCADARVWVQSGYRDLSVPSREFEASQAAHRHLDREERSPDALLKPYENAADRALIRKTTTVEDRLVASDIGAVHTIFHVDRIVGFPRAPFEETKQVTVGHGSTAAGTNFEVSTESRGALGASRTCHRSATVAYSRPGAPEVLILGGPNNPICLAPPHYHHPAVFCESGIETIQTAVPASVRSARLVLADGQTIHSRVVRIPRRHGGPAGIYTQEIRGSTSHAVSLVELNAGGDVVLTLKLPRYRCVKQRRESDGFPTVKNLASGHTPEGEPFTISAFGSLNTDPSNILTPFLSIDTGVNPELGEPAIGPGARKAFPWSLSIGCAPHPYAILYGILAPPGTSVVAQAPQGAVALNLVPVEPRLHANGPLVYGVFSALPSQLTVLAANGSTVYTENLKAKGAEAAQFCEGYAEP
jgi:hypothetical protein